MKIRGRVVAPVVGTHYECPHGCAHVSLHFGFADGGGKQVAYTYMRAEDARALRDGLDEALARFPSE